MLRKPTSVSSAHSEPSLQNDSNGTWAELPWTTCSDLPRTGTSFDTCHPWETTTFLPLLADELYLTAIGCGFSGRICINADGEDANVIRVDVTMYSTSPCLQGEVKVRRCQPEPGKYGLMFVVCPRQRCVHFHHNHATVRLPPTSTSTIVSSFTSTFDSPPNASCHAQSPSRA